MPGVDRNGPVIMQYVRGNKTAACVFDVIMFKIVVSPDRQKVRRRAEHILSNGFAYSPRS